MKIKITDFGPLKNFEFDLTKKLIVTYGNNNIGKSYAMQIVYLLLKTFIGRKNIYPLRTNIQYNINYPIRNLILPIDENLKELIKRFIESDISEKDITKVVEKILFQSLSESILPEFMVSCGNTFGNFQKILEKDPVILLEFDEYHLTIHMKKNEIYGSVPFLPIKLKKTESGMYGYRTCKNHLDVYVFHDEIQRPIAVILDQLNSAYTKLLHPIATEFRQVYFLPASRSGIYSGMNAFGAIVAELSKNRALLTKKIELPGISEPISDYFISLSNIANKINFKRRNTEKLSDHYLKIEDTILKGKVSFDKGKNALVYTPNDLEEQFEMTEVSSMVSEVSPIVAFLKYIIGMYKTKEKNNAILFIEEPEAHLHPSNQIKLIEIFSELASEGLTLIVSSHSNYVFNKLNNLILSQKLDYHIYQPIFLEQGTDGSYSKLLSIDECGADDENFVDVSEYLYNEREDIIQNLNLGDE